MVEEKELFYEKKLKDFFNKRASKLNCIKLKRGFLTLLKGEFLFSISMSLLLLIDLQLKRGTMKDAWYYDRITLGFIALGFLIALFCAGYYCYTKWVWLPRVKKDLDILVDYLDDKGIITIKVRLRELKKDDVVLFDKRTSKLLGEDFAGVLNREMRVECARVLIENRSIRMLSKHLGVEISDKLLCFVVMLEAWSSEKLIYI